jgi:hypothetical protein
MGRGEFSPTTLPSLSLSLTPSLSAPAIVPTLNAVDLPSLHSPSVAVQNPSPLIVPLSLSHTVVPAASKADDVRDEVAKAVANWKSARAKAPASASAAPSADSNNPTLQLDALFDGSLPHSRDILARASSLGLHDAALALALSDSKSPADAAARLSSLGVLGSKEASLSGTREDEFRFMLTRVWRQTAASIPSPFAVDAGFGIPALKVHRDGVTYYVHAVAHGQYGAPRRSAVLTLVRKIAASGQALYSEQNLPAYYGYKLGFETLDHESAAGAPARVVPAAPGYSLPALALKRAIDWAVSPGSALAALAWVLLVPASPWAWAALAGFGALAWLVLTGGLPLMRWKRRRLAAGARAEGLEDIAEQYADEARDFFVAKPDLEVLRGLELPQPLGATGDALSVRSRAIADAVAAASAGAPVVHLVVGHLHAHEVASRLANGPRTDVPGSQVS